MCDKNNNRKLYEKILNSASEEDLQPIKILSNGYPNRYGPSNVYQIYYGSTPVSQVYYGSTKII
jgi:hypothetical protein